MESYSIEAAKEGRPFHIEQASKTRWKNEIQELKIFLRWFEETDDIRTKLDILYEMFTCILGYRAFLAANPIFRDSVRSKITELRAYRQTGTPLLELLDNVERMLSLLFLRDDYRA